MHDDITELKRDIGLDCGDHSCRYAVVRTGMRTNGGCRCEPPAKQIADLTAKLKAKDSALEFAYSAIGDAIYLEDGLDGETGQRVQRIIVQALERGTFDVPGGLGDFLVKRERAAQDQNADLTRRLEEAQARAQRPPEPYESVCHACDGSGWVSA